MRVFLVRVRIHASVRSVCNKDTDAPSDDSEEEIIEEFGSSDDTSDGELHPQLLQCNQLVKRKYLYTYSHALFTN